MHKQLILSNADFRAIITYFQQAHNSEKRACRCVNIKCYVKVILQNVPMYGRDTLLSSGVAATRLMQ